METQTTNASKEDALGELFTIEHFINGNRVLERLEIAEHFHIKVTDLQRLLASITSRVRMYKAGNKHYYDLEDLTREITEYRNRTQKKAASAAELDKVKLAKKKAVILDMVSEHIQH